mgnify:CR=1 FL=1
MLHNLIKNIYSKFIKPPYKVPLGRWNINYSKSHINSQYANSDNCGDIICKEPRLVKILIEKECKEKNNNIN